jgi:hypothetical protein
MKSSQKNYSTYNTQNIGVLETLFLFNKNHQLSLFVIFLLITHIIQHQFILYMIANEVERCILGCVESRRIIAVRCRYFSLNFAVVQLFQTVVRQWLIAFVKLVSKQFTTTGQ